MGVTDENGLFTIDDILIGDGYSVTVAKLGYNDSTKFNDGIGYTILEGEVTEVNFDLLHPEFNIDVNEFSFQMNADDSLSEGIFLSNDGDGTLIYNSKFIYLLDQEAGEPGAGQSGSPGRDEPADIWDPLLQWSASDSTGDHNLQGIAYIDDYWIVSGPGDGDMETSWFYKFDRWGNFLDSIPQPIADSRLGLRNLTYYEGYVYAAYADERSILKLDPASWDSVGGWYFPEDLPRPSCLTIDNDGNFWVASSVNKIFKLELVGDSTLVEIESFDRDDPNNPGRRLRTYGFSWFRDDPDGYSLYMVTSDREYDAFAIHKMHPITGDIILLTTLPYLEEGARGKSGICITPKWNNLVWVMGIIVEYTDGDEIIVAEIAPNSSWIDYSPRTDTLFATESVPIEVIIETADLDTGQYGVVIEFSHNAEGGSTLVSVELLITTLSTPDDNLMPIEYSLEQNFPNPFNPSTSIQYSLREPGLTRLLVYDIMGREVMELVNDNQPAGRYQVSFEGNAIPTGLYFYRISSGEFTAVKKMLLVK